QRRAGRELGSDSAVADSRQTLLCTYLSAAVLLGLLVHAAVGLWWADPVAALVLAVLAVREGRNAWRGEVCCSPRSLPARDQPARLRRRLLPVGSGHQGPRADRCGPSQCRGA